MLTSEHKVKNHLLQNLVSAGKLECASQFKLNKSVRNGVINQHSKIRCSKPGWLVWAFCMLGAGALV